LDENLIKPEDAMKHTIDTLTDQFNKGYTNKARKQEALRNLNSLYYNLRRILMNDILDQKIDQTVKENIDQIDNLYWSIPQDLHLWKPSHSASTININQDVVEHINNLKELRDCVKLSPIVPPIEREANLKKERVEKSIREFMEYNKTQFARGLRLNDYFGGLNVTVNAHLVTMYSMTYVRCFYYLHGKLTALNTIIAVAQEIKDREEANGI
jgi:hypothetical protein